MHFTRRKSRAHQVCCRGERQGRDAEWPQFGIDMLGVWMKFFCIFPKVDHELYDAGLVHVFSSTLHFFSLQSQENQAQLQRVNRHEHVQVIYTVSISHQIRPFIVKTIDLGSDQCHGWRQGHRIRMVIRVVPTRPRGCPCQPTEIYTSPECEHTEDDDLTTN